MKLPGAAKSGAAAASELYPRLRAARISAPPGELAAFTGLAVANQYRLAYGLTLSLLSPGAAVLDWGCGDGHFSYFLLTAGHVVSAFSIQHEPHLLVHLPESLRARYRYVQGDARDPSRLPFADASFDAVFSIGVLEHVREQGGTEVGSLRELRRVLRPGGLVICCHLPNTYSVIESTAAAIHALGRRGEAPHHQFRFRRRDILELCDGAGLDVVMTRRYGFVPRNVLGHLPAGIKDSPGFTALLNAVDDGLALALPIVCQNHAFVARPRRAAC